MTRFRPAHLVAVAWLGLAAALAAPGVARAESPGFSLTGPPAGMSDGSFADAGSESETPANELVVPESPEHAQPLHMSNLGIMNFFSEGWNQEWDKWRHYTPDMALLRVTTNFLERELRADYANTSVANSRTLDSTDFANVLMAYALNRRLMLEVIGNYQWNDNVIAAPVSGSGAGFLTRFQLVENADQSYSFQARVSPPNKGIGQTQTSLTFALAGWQDVHSWVPALGRFGLYYSFQYEDLVGPRKVGQMTSDISYDVSFAETWTSPTTCVFGNFTTFLEFFGQTALDGATSGKTNVTADPGSPLLVHSREFHLPGRGFSGQLTLPAIHTVYRATYILNF